MLHQYSSGLAERLASGETIKGYNGFDPTGTSLHIGHLVPIFGLIHLQRAGGIPVIVVGGGTAMIGDPSGRSAERMLLSRSAVEENIVGIQSQLTRFIDFDGPHGAELVDTVQTVDCSNRRVHSAPSCRRAAEPLGLAPLSATLWNVMKREPHR
jgi:tyrosyl-tRNA synthetase